MNRKILIICIFGAAIMLLAMAPIMVKPDTFVSPEEWDRFVAERLMHAPPDTNHLFPTASRCLGCHGYDPQMHAMVDFMGNDVNIHDDWSTTMMANSAKDPFWRAKVSHETLANPSHQLDLETKCTSCHAPQGHFTALLRGAEHYSITEMAGDTIALDGVSCGACHMKAEKDLDKLFSGEANYDTSFISYGPYEMPFAAPMNDFVGFNPVYSEHINDAGICASCHTLVTKSVDITGEYTGNSFVEQATYHEWINSIYDDEGDDPETCQGCHMPRLEESVVISANYLFLQARAPYALHDFIGSNTTMIDMIKHNKEHLEIEAADEHFDETLSKTLEMLQQRSVDLDFSFKGNDADTAYFEVELLNKAGHKFPSGYPSRRVFIEFVATTSAGDTLFKSGVPNENFEILPTDVVLEPHHNLINAENQVQIYEMIPADVNGNVTTLLEQADYTLKDNRLTPIGFVKNHSVYDTTSILGEALNDSDFNYKDGIEGSGTDRVKYHIPINGYSGLMDVAIRVHYQTIAPRWVKPMFEESSVEIDVFKEMYEDADLSTVVVAQEIIEDLNIESLQVNSILENSITIFPNPTHNGLVNIESKHSFQSVKIYSLLGELVLVKSLDGTTLHLPLEKGLYYLEFEIDGKRVRKEIISQ